MQKIITIANQKGGVGKTTTTMNLAAGLVKKGKKVLIIDFDPQANLSTFLGYRRDEDESGEPTISDLLECAAKGLSFDTSVAIRSHEEGIDFIPSDIGLADADIYLVSAMCREQVLKRLFQTPAIFAYEYIIIDCNPSLGLLLTNALVASTAIIIPVQAQMFSLKGMNALLDVIQQVRNFLNPQLVLTGVLATMVDKTNMSQAVIEALNVDYGDYLFKTQIPRLIEAANATATGASSVSVNDSRIGQAYIQLAEEVISREGN